MAGPKEDDSVFYCTGRMVDTNAFTGVRTTTYEFAVVPPNLIQELRNYDRMEQRLLQVIDQGGAVSPPVRHQLEAVRMRREMILRDLPRFTGSITQGTQMPAPPFDRGDITKRSELERFHIGLTDVQQAQRAGQHR
ncbi:MAG TPA: hypothetical protein VLD37_04200 [Candidatus Bilamarchaeum sp.]|nr:hypothetical protein [Candidatus Bilamarchaeum sp.]